MSETRAEVPYDNRFDPFRFLKWGGIALALLTIASTLVFYAMGRYYGRHDWSIMNCKIGRASCRERVSSPV